MPEHNDQEKTLTPTSFRQSWLTARTVTALGAVLAAQKRRVSVAGWAAFWAAYSPAAHNDRRSPAARFAAEQHEAAENALAAAVADSPRVQAAVARTHSREYWLEVYGAVDREMAALRQARYLTALTAPGWAADPRWRTSDVLALVAAAVRTADFTVMPILADALEDAGCDNAEWLKLMRDGAQPWFVCAGVLVSLR